jgi:hypothetical protein
MSCPVHPPAVFFQRVERTFLYNIRSFFTTNQELAEHPSADRQLQTFVQNKMNKKIIF